MRFSNSHLIQVKEKITLNCLLCSIFLLCIFGCDNKQELPSNNITKLHFNIIPDLLGPKITNSSNSFEFNPPAFLFEMPKDSIALSTAVFKEIINDSLKVSMLYAFQDSSQKNYLLVAKILFPKDSIFSLLDKYEDVLFNMNFFVEAEKTRYLKDGLLISQFILNKAEYVFIKIFFESKNKSLIQFDYILSLKEYKDRVRSIESSLGSIVLL